MDSVVAEWKTRVRASERELDERDASAAVGAASGLMEHVGFEEFVDRYVVIEGDGGVPSSEGRVPSTGEDGEMRRADAHPRPLSHSEMGEGSTTRPVTRRGAVPFRMFGYQRERARAWEAGESEIILKARQLG